MTNPYTKGPGKYPNKFVTKFYHEFARVLNEGGTKFNKIPIIVGKQKAPPNNSPQSNAINIG